MLVATHDMELVAELCPRTLVMHRGTIVADGATHRIFDDRELLETCGLEAPAIPCRHPATV